MTDLNIKKLRKLIRSPGLYFRDYFLKRYPIPLQKSPTYEWTGKEQPGTSADEILKAADLGISTASSANIVNLYHFDAEFALRSLAHYCMTNGQRAWYVADDGSCNILTPTLELADLRANCTDNGRISLRLTDQYNRLITYFSVMLWEEAPPSSLAQIRAVSNTAPVKLWADNCPASSFALTTDLSRVDPVDVVFTWVNAADETWQQLIAPHLQKKEAVDPDRYTQSDELRYAIRSIETHAPWIRRIYILTNCRQPNWFKATERHIWIDHKDVIDEEYLPTFNSHVIETFLHKIPELSNKFIYMNDDVFLSKECAAADLFSYGGRSRSFFEPYGTTGFYHLYPESSELAEWQQAAVNGARLIHARFGIFPVRLHQHVPHILRRDTYEQMETDYSSELHRVRCNRFRDPSDISFTSFFYHHYANLIGDAVESTSESFIIRNSNYRTFRNRITKKGNAYSFICINDGNGSSSDEEFKNFKINFLAERFPLRSSCEI